MNTQLPSRSSQKVWIYGIFQLGKAVYIGQTVNPRARCGAHHYSGNLEGCEFVLIREADREHGYRLERQIIDAYKRRGEAVRNMCAGGGGGRLRKRTDLTYCIFQLPADLDNFFKAKAKAKLMSKADLIRGVLLGYRQRQEQGG